MNLDLLKNEPRLLIEASLQPIAGTRFQPTGFPDLGAATYKTPENTDMLLVESAQSMANHLENVCWDEGADTIATALAGLPYVESTLPDGSKTNSILEAHRLNSPYIINSLEFAEIEKAVGFEKNKPFNRRRLAAALFKYDPCSIIHGAFLEKIGGVVRLPRALTAFIEAKDVIRASSGGVKFDRVQPESTGKNTAYGKAEDGYGNVPYHKDEFTGKIVVTFCLDLSLLRGLGLSPSAVDLLTKLSIYKIVAFLDHGLRLRTACDLEMVRCEIKRPKGDLTLPSLADASSALGEAINRMKVDFGPSPFPVRYDAKVAKAKKAAKKKQQETEHSDDDQESSNA
jgi:CRISPR-associated protein Csb1